MDSKFAHIIVFFLLALSFETLNAQKNGLEFIKLVKELKSVHEPKPNLECQGKLMWPELIGVPAQYAKGIIEKENPLTDVQIVLNGSPVTTDLSCNRVQIAVNILDIAVSMPVVG
ncbi:hypothetical protein EJD97_008405 [Solanum chilense]|uniref:Uncharacterized protein n=1 Tax=Solanum chilense TaxID=4083 RepID=A0A6N2AHD1_SOLCI|nr:hypothetical protein EJD97_008405 [Solanum chilense]